MTTTRDVHQETVTLLSDAVTDITKRAVEPTLAPFGAELRETIAALDVRMRSLDELLGDDRADRQRLTRQVGELMRTTSAGTDTVGHQVEEVAGALDQLTALATANAATIERLRRLAFGLSVALVVTAALLVGLAALAVLPAR
ncbi:hypothetical protein [Cryptosporangium aurantiacum]|uniref:Uncharacterized protein n=1 Tax=Cryptosporangium aurantiacum TaxID=134849 RepID=A0A1M7TXB0_9ACTN|nr:hypothetical protein [Cryptosporangium aurantiacum]SHN75384.1 hypothetical protein SAMN05443668_107284 [Cryptosporangium aurantiacum]